MLKVSVIIPVYNGEKYLHQCLDSVCEQTLKEIEIICVDDGSTDGSYEILEQYQKKDDRFILFKQQNKFAGAARNLGKQHAKGEYLIFWDCDDFFERNALEVLYQRAKEMDADICVCGAYRFYSDMEESAAFDLYMKKKYVQDLDVFNRETNPDYILNFTNDAPWNKLYRRTFIEESGIDFQEIRNGNDVYFTVNAMCMADRVTTVTDKLIHYRKNLNEGLVGTLSKAPMAPYHAWTSAAENLRKNNMFPERSFANKACESILYLLRNISTREAFMEVMHHLQKEGLEVLGLQVREPGYYYDEWHAQVVEHLNQDTPEDFQTFLAYNTYIRMARQDAKNRLARQKADAKRKEAEKELKALKNTFFRKVIRRIKKLFKR